MRLASALPVQRRHHPQRKQRRENKSEKGSPVRFLQRGFSSFGIRDATAFSQYPYAVAVLSFSVDNVSVVADNKM